MTSVHDRNRALIAPLRAAFRDPTLDGVRAALLNAILYLNRQSVVVMKGTDYPTEGTA